MDRRAEVLGTLSDGIAPFVLREVCSPEWLETYPGGFAPLAPIEAGNVIEVCPERIVAHGEALLDDQFRAFTRAIHAWLDHSAMDLSLQLPADLVVAKFLQDFPSAAHVLTLVASFVDIPLDRFLGARMTS